MKMTIIDLYYINIDLYVIALFYHCIKNKYNISSRVKYMLSLSIPPTNMGHK